MTNSEIEQLATQSYDSAINVEITMTYGEWEAATDLLDIAAEVSRKHEYERLAAKLEILSIRIQRAMGVFDDE